MLGWIFTEYVKKEIQNPFRTKHKFTNTPGGLTGLFLCSLGDKFRKNKEAEEDRE